MTDEEGILRGLKLELDELFSGFPIQWVWTVHQSQSSILTDFEKSKGLYLQGKSDFSQMVIEVSITKDRRCLLIGEMTKLIKLSSERLFLDDPNCFQNVKDLIIQKWKEKLTSQKQEFSNKFRSCALALLQIRKEEDERKR